MTMPAKVLIANRGEIAVRIVSTLRHMGIASVVVHHALDAGGRAVLEADEAVLLEGEPPVSAYLDGAAIIAACLRTGADAVHPGYGFLAENAAFAQAVVDAGLTFIGPRPDAIRAMGDKIESKRLAAAAGVPVLPGSDGEVQGAEEALAVADRIGYPVLLKASAGGGGKGMRIARSAAECADAFARAEGEATAAFGDGRVFVERFVERPRHVEVQVLGDVHGTVVHLGERECSIQRRYQKVVEEAPSPSVDAATRARMGEAAVALARAVGYVSAGTVEMVADPDGGFYFLEMNTRLQVEHPVTELVTGIDIVEQQLRIAAGEPLGFAQADVRLDGSAIECRVYGEDPAEGFMPATGPIGRLRLPDGEGVAVHHGLREGGVVSAAFDPMLAKVAAWGPTREQAIARVGAALRETVVLGTTTNTAYLERVVGHPAFAAGETYTSFLDEHAADLVAPPPSAELERLLVAAAALASPRFDARHELQPLHAAIGPWRRGPAHPDGGDVLEVTVDAGRPHRVSVTRGDGGAALVLVDGRPVAASLRRVGERHAVGADALRELVDLHLEHDTVHVHARGRAWRVAIVDPVVRAAAAGAAVDVVSAPMPGTVVRLPVAAGEAVLSGQPLVVIESMKMQSELTAQRDGVVARVHLAVGDTFDRGAALVTLDGEDA